MRGGCPPLNLPLGLAPKVHFAPKVDGLLQKSVGAFIATPAILLRTLTKYAKVVSYATSHIR